MIKKFKTDFPFLKLKSNIMSESQLIEYKESWRDEYLKWICASFACQNSFSKTRSGLRRFANDQDNALNSFLMKKIGVIWESLIEEKIEFFKV